MNAYFRLLYLTYYWQFWAILLTWLTAWSGALFSHETETWKGEDENIQERQSSFSAPFAYRPDKNLGKFPFGVLLDFILRLDEVWVLRQRFWQIELISYSQQSYITMYRRRMDDLHQTMSEQSGQKWLADLQQGLALEAYQFLYQYFSCSREGKEFCDA